MTINLNFDEILKKADSVELPKIPNNISGGTGKASFSIVNNRNGKRLSFSKKLSVDLNLDDCVELLPIADEGVLMIARKLPYTNARKCKLNGEGKKITYNSEAVAVVTAAFNLNFKSKTSMSFDEIQMEQLDDETPVALVKIYNKGI